MITRRFLWLMTFVWLVFLLGFLTVMGWLGAPARTPLWEVAIAVFSQTFFIVTVYRILGYLAYREYNIHRAIEEEVGDRPLPPGDDHANGDSDGTE